MSLPGRCGSSWRTQWRSSLSEGESNNTCEESETKVKAAPANASQGNKNSSQRNRHQQHLTVKLLFFFLLKLFIYSLWILNHASWSYSSPCPFSSALSHCNLTSPPNKIKVKSIAITQTDKQKFSVWKLYCGPVSHTVYSLSSTCVFCNGLLVWL